MELGDVRRTSKVDLVENNTQTSMNERIVLGIVLFFGVVSIVAVILAAVAVGRPGGLPGSAQGQADRGARSTGGGSAPVVNCNSGSGGSGGSKEKRIWTIAVGHDWGAYSYVDSKGYLAGFCLDLVAEVCQAAGMDCRTVWAPYTDCFDSDAGQHPKGGRGLHDRWFDACEAWLVTVTRQSMFKFAASFNKPYMSQFVVKKGNPTGFSETDILKAKKVGFIDGWAYDEKCVFRMYDQLLPAAKIIHYNGQDNVKDALMSGEIDAAYVGETDLYEYTEGSSAILERIGSKKQCMVRGSAPVSRKDSDFPARWNEGFNKIVSNGRFKKLCDDAKNIHGHRGSVDCV